jgi:hypothetical protein
MSRADIAIARETFTTSRKLDYASEKELSAQIGHGRSQWPLVILKELVDNAIDACEEVQIAPEVTVAVDEHGITVSDNGPGLPPETIGGVLNFDVRISSREAYVAPTRGAQGNALKTLLAMPFVLDGMRRGRIVIEARGIRHTLDFSVDRVRQEPVVEHGQEPSFVKTGTVVKVFWPDCSRTILDEAMDDFLQMIVALRLINPHLSISATWGNKEFGLGAPTNPKWMKWRPSDPAPASWYGPSSFERLVGAYVTHGRARRRDRTVREFVSEFRGLSGSAKQKLVLDASGLARAPLSALISGRDFDRTAMGTLRAAMQEHSKPVQPEALGVIGEDHFRAAFDGFGCDMDSFVYKRASGMDHDMPWLFEVAFVHVPNLGLRRIYNGVNWSACIIDPFRGFSLDGILAQQKADAWKPVLLAIHFACPEVHYLDRGKSGIRLNLKQNEALQAAIEFVTKKWAKTQTALERNRRAAERDAHRKAEEKRLAEEAAARGEQVKETLKSAAYRFMESAWLKASNGGTLPALARQIMYAIRGDVQKATGQKLDAKYFTQTLLPDYIAETGATWNVVFDPRGHFTEPHGGKRFELGTVEVRQYLKEVRPAGSWGPGNVKGRYGAVLYVEKEGFDRLFHQLHLADRFDIAIVSTKGNSTTAFRELAETLCSEHDIPLFIAHDFDVAGFTIAGILGEDGDTRRYQFTKPFRRVDLGLRLADVEAYELESESVAPPSPAQIETLRRHGATEAEITFLASGQRVELNAFMGDGIVRWLESKLIEHGVSKVSPPPEMIRPIYRQSARDALIEAKMREYRAQLERETPEFPDPPDLYERMTRGLSETPAKSWQQQVSDLAADDVGQ